MYYCDKMKLVPLLFFFVALLSFPIIAEDNNIDIEAVFSSNNYQAIKQLVEMEVNKENPSAYVIQRYAQFLLSQSLVTEAIAQLLDAQNLPDADYYQISYWLSYSYALAGDYAQALTYAKIHYEKNLYSEQALIEYIWLLYKNLNESEAISIAEQNTSIFPNSITLYSILALLKGEEGDYEMASFYYEKADAIALELAIDPIHLITNYYNQFILEMHFLHFQRAEALLQKAYGIAPDQPLILRLLGEFYHDQMDYHQSKFYYELSEQHEIAQVTNNESLRTPLGKLGLIDLYLDFMQLTSAKKLIDEVKREKDKFAWMKPFGINPIFFDTLWREKEIRYWKLVQQELNYSINNSFADHLDRIKLFFMIRHLEILQKKSYLNAISHAKNLQHLENRIHYSLAATNRYPLIQLYMVNQAHTVKNTPITQQKLLEQEASLKNSISLHQNLLSQLQPPYQNRIKMSILLNILNNRKLSREDRLYYTANLFTINPSSTQKFSMPMQLVISTKNRSSHKRILKFLQQIHIIEYKDSLYRLHLTEQENYLEVSLFYDNQKIKDFTITFDGKSWRQIFEEVRIHIFYLQ